MGFQERSRWDRLGVSVQPTLAKSLVLCHSLSNYFLGHLDLDSQFDTYCFPLAHDIGLCLGEQFSQVCMKFQQLVYFLAELVGL